ncbi:MAG: TIGR02301 family protein, partial [Proteobacteria bacterium]|nr:TIGR02301 family protein [Pseudomonadota bacterium]
KLVRLSEILGAVHYLRELCGQSDGQQWRDRMRELLEADGGSALRRAMLSRSFNNGYRSYGRTYQSCTPTAQTAIGKFLAEGAQIADGLTKSVP